MGLWQTRHVKAPFGLSETLGVVTGAGGIMTTRKADDWRGRGPEQMGQWLSNPSLMLLWHVGHSILSPL